MSESLANYGDNHGWEMCLGFESEFEVGLGLGNCVRGVVCINPQLTQPLLSLRLWHAP